MSDFMDDDLTPEEEAYLAKLTKRYKRRTGFFKYYQILDFNSRPMGTRLIIECAIWGRRLFTVPLWKMKV